MIRKHTIFLVLPLMACGARTGLLDPEVESVNEPATPADAGDGPNRPWPPPEPAPDRPAPPPEPVIVDAGPAPDSGPAPCLIPAPVDLLLVVDDSGSMWEEQVSLAEQLPRLVSDLVHPPDADGDGNPDWRAIEDLQLGVVTTSASPICDNLGDGVLRTAGAPGDSDCQAAYPSFLAYDNRDSTPSETSADFSCVARVGTDGCGIEQPLEAALKALLPAETELEFFGNPPVGNRANAGFLRDDSMLAIVVLSDEDDCSISSAEFPERENDEELPECLGDNDPLYPVERYVDAFRSLRPARPDLFTFSVIGGIPPRLVRDPTTLDYDAILRDSFMIARYDRTAVGFFPRLVPACDGRWGRAFPARRLVQVAQAFGDQSALASICERNYGPVVGAIARHVGTRACEEREAN